MLVLYPIGVVAVAIVLSVNLLAAWTTFLAITAIVFVLAFRSIFPAPINDEARLQVKSETSVTFMMKELESKIAKGFMDQDLQAQEKTFETLARIFRRKIIHKYGMNDAEIKTLIRNPIRLEETVRDPELVQLLTHKLNLNQGPWDLLRLSKLIGKVEDWNE